MSRIGEGRPSGEAPSEAPNFNACWDDFKRLTLNLQAVEDEGVQYPAASLGPSFPTVVKTARQPDELGDHARSQLVIRRRLKAILQNMQQLDQTVSLADLENLSLAQLGEPKGHAHDIIGDLLFDAFDDWASKKENKKKLTKMKKDPAYMLFQQEHVHDDSPYGYAWDQLLRRLFYGKQ